MTNIAIVSSGNEQKDKEELEKAQLFDNRIKQGLCPNGCAFLEWQTAFNAQCPECKFLYSTNVSYGKSDSGEVM